MKMFCNKKSFKSLIGYLMAGIAIISVPAYSFAQASVPAPGSLPGGGGPGGFGGGSVPAPGSLPGGAGGPLGPNSLMGPGNGPALPPPNWGSPWSPNPMNNGTARVLACGYDYQGVWRVIPIRVAYQYNGVQYQVTVINAWNPWMDMWNRNVDQPAYNTTYMLRGQEYNFYTVLSTGTYYFNL